MAYAEAVRISPLTLNVLSGGGLIGGVAGSYMLTDDAPVYVTAPAVVVGSLVGTVLGTLAALAVTTNGVTFNDDLIRVRKRLGAEAVAKHSGAIPAGLAEEQAMRQAFELERQDMTKLLTPPSPRLGKMVGRGIARSAQLEHQIANADPRSNKVYWGLASLEALAEMNDVNVRYEQLRARLPEDVPDDVQVMRDDLARQLDELGTMKRKRWLHPDRAQLGSIASGLDMLEALIRAR